MKKTLLSAVLLCGILFCTPSIQAQTLDSTATALLNGWVTKYNLTPTQTQVIKPFIISEDSVLLNLKSRPASKSNTSLINATKKAFNDTIRSILKQDRIVSNLTTLSYKYRKMTASDKQSIKPLLVAKITELQNVDSLNISASTKDSLKYALGTEYDNQITAKLESVMQWTLATKYGLTSGLDSVATIGQLTTYNLKLIQTQDKLGMDPYNTVVFNALMDLMINPPALIANLVVAARTTRNENKGKYLW